MYYYYYFYYYYFSYVFGLTIMAIHRQNVDTKEHLMLKYINVKSTWYITHYKIN
jgi:hypothetical protein